MKFYCGIDLSARDCHVNVIDERLQVMVQQKLRNELGKIVKLLEPYKANLKIVVESTFNWYWLIDGLQAEGFEVVLAHTLGLYLITGAKVKTDRRDAFALAKLLLGRRAHRLHLSSRDSAGAGLAAPAPASGAGAGR
jgi:transposase